MNEEILAQGPAEPWEPEPPPSQVTGAASGMERCGQEGRLALQAVRVCVGGVAGFLLVAAEPG